MIVIALGAVALLVGTSAVLAGQGGRQCFKSSTYRSGPDYVMINGNVITVDKHFSKAQAVAVQDGKIVAVGSNSAVLRLKRGGTKVLNLKGATVLPGINDAHNHLGGFGLSRPPLVLDVAYPTVTSFVDIRNMIADRVAQIQPGDWITGSGWDRGFIAELTATPQDDWPSKGDIDAVSPNNPIALTDFSGHVCWANSAALAAAGITNDTPSPPSGTIVKDPVTGEPTGILLERAAGLVRGLVPPTTDAQRRQGILNAMAEVNSLGITSVTEPGLGAGQISMYNDLYNEGLLTVRMNLMVMGANSLDQVKNTLNYVGTHTGFGNDMLRISGFKILADGIPPSRTGFMYPGVYLDGSTAQLLIKGDTDAERKAELDAIVKYVNARNFQIGCHTTGDRGIAEVVDAYIQALQDHPWDARHYVIHCDYTRPETAKLMAKWDILANVQSTIKWTIGNLMIGIVGEEQAAYQWPLRTLIDAGVVVTNSSDASVTYPDWRQGVESAILREDKATGNVSGADQCITLKEALQTYTINGAYQDHMEKVRGSVEAGKLADFCIIGRNIMKVDAHEISDIPILMTILGGNVVYNNSSLKIK